MVARIGERVRGHARRDDHLDELPLDDGLRGDGVQLTVEGDDAAESRVRIGLISAVIGFELIRAQRHAAGIGVLDDDAGGAFGEGLDTFQRGVGVGDVVVGQFFALQLAALATLASRTCARRRSCLLVWVLAVTHILGATVLQTECARERARIPPGWMRQDNWRWRRRSALCVRRPSPQVRNGWRR